MEKKKDKKNIGIYIHIPFCKSKCSYCDFLSFELNNEFMIEEYIKALIYEIKNTDLKIKQLYSNTSKDNTISLSNINSLLVDTIYFGGGTPSLIKAEYIANIINAIRSTFNISQDVEITIEANPESISREKLTTYKEVGINRVSIGLQTTDNTLLKRIGRLHSYEEFKEKYELVRNLFNNISIDLIFGLPGQNLDMVKKDLNEVLNLSPEHISTYSLILEENTQMYNEVSQFKIKLPEDTLNRDMYWLIKKTLEENNYTHYEISNFSKKNKESKHNAHYWNQDEYLSYGIGASSYFNNIRFSNISNMPLYIDNTNNDVFDIEVEEIQNKQDVQKEYMLLQLRNLKGVDIDKFKSKFKKSPLDTFKKELEKLENLELIFIDKNSNSIRLTNKGLDLANLVWQEFI